MHPRFWTAQGVAAVILATTLGGGFAAVYVISALQGVPVNEQVAAQIDHMGSGLVGALAGWLGGSAVARDRDMHPVVQHELPEGVRAKVPPK